MPFWYQIFISALFVATIYHSSSTSVVFADVSCIDFDKKTKICATSEGGMYNCIKGNDGKWTCTKKKEEANVPPGLADALDDVIAAEAPNDGKILSENEDTAENDSSRANISALD